MPDGKPLHIAFAFIGGADWSAGSIFYSSLFAALRMLEAERRPHVSLLVSSMDDPSSYCDLSSQADNVLVFEEPKSHASRLRRMWKRLSARRSPSIDRLLSSNGVDCLFCTSLREPACAVPVVGWLPDFQHARLPDMFTEEEKAARNLHFRRLIDNAERIVVTSSDVLNDLKRFAPGTDKGRLVPFAAHVPDEVIDVDASYVNDAYKLPDRYFHLPNQFWKHKNHKVVLEALSIARRSEPNITVVCTGNLRDYRHPEFLNELMLEVSKRDLRNNFIILGLVPRKDMFSLMRRSIAVIQPSLFEGLSMTVQEARMLGKQIIVSDIPVLRELAPEGSRFFDPADAEALAALLVQSHDAAVSSRGRVEVVADAMPSARSDAEQAAREQAAREQEAREQAPRLMRAFGESFLSIVEEAAGRNSSFAQKELEPGPRSSSF